MAILNASVLFGGKIAATVDADPRVEAHDLWTGSIMLWGTRLFEKLDDGNTTNVREIPISRGDTFITNPVGGDTFYREDLNENFYWDPIRGAWLGCLVNFTAGRNGTAGKRTYLHHDDGMVGSDVQGIYIPYDFTIVGMTFARGEQLNSGDLEVHLNGTLIPGAVLSTGVANSGEDMTLNCPSSGGVMAVYWNSTKNTGDVQVLVMVRRRAE